MNANIRDIYILNLAESLREADDTQRPYRIDDHDATGEYAVSATVAECIRRAAAQIEAGVTA